MVPTIMRLAEGNIKAAIRTAHTLKGASGMIEARQIYGLALAVEEVLDKGEVEAGFALIERLEERLIPLLQAIRKATDGAALPVQDKDM